MTDIEGTGQLCSSPFRVGDAWLRGRFDGRPLACAGANGREAVCAREIVEAMRAAHSPLVLTSGTFDLLNVGHERYLDMAASCGNALVVGVDSDEKVRRRKGLNRPVICEHLRVASVANHPQVALAIVKNAHAMKWSLIREVRPDVLVVSDRTYSRAELADLGSYCGLVVEVKRIGALSTSRIIDEPLHRENEHHSQPSRNQQRPVPPNVELGMCHKS